MKDLVRKRMKLIGKVVVTTILVLVLLHAIDWSAVWIALRDMRWQFVLLFCVLYVCGILISAWKWMLIARHADLKDSYSFFVRSYLVGTFVNNFLPSFVGGDAYRIFSLGATRGRVTDAMATVVMDRVSGLFTLLFYAIIFMGFMQDVMSAQVTVDVIWYGLVACFVVGVMIVVGISRRWYGKIMDIVPHIVQKNVRALGQFHDKRVYGVTFFASTLFVLIGIMLANYVLFMACDVSITFWQYASVILVTNVIAALPITIGNIGTKEWAYIFLFGLFGVSSAVLIAIVLVSRVVQLLVSLIAMPFFLQVKDLVPKKTI